MNALDNIKKTYQLSEEQNALLNKYADAYNKGNANEKTILEGLLAMSSTLSKSQDDFTNSLLPELEQALKHFESGTLEDHGQPVLMLANALKANAKKIKFGRNGG